MAKRLRLLRMASGMTLEQLASAIGISIASMQKYEVLGSRISVARLQQIAVFFGVPVTYFFEGDAEEDAGRDSYAELLKVPGALELLKLHAGADDPLLQSQIRLLVETTARLEAAATNPQAAPVQEAGDRATRH